MRVVALVENIVVVLIEVAESLIYVWRATKFKGHICERCGIAEARFFQDMYSSLINKEKRTIIAVSFCYFGGIYGGKSQKEKYK